MSNYSYGRIIINGGNFFKQSRNYFNFILTVQNVIICLHQKSTKNKKLFFFNIESKQWMLFKHRRYTRKSGFF